MIKANKNIIKNQTIAVHYTGNTDAVVMNNMITAWSSSSLNVAVNKALQAYTEKDVVMQIDSLEIDIDVQEGEGWQNAVNEQVQNSLARQLQQAANGRLPGVHVVMPAAAFFESLVYFLQYGYLDWNTAGAGKKAFDEAMLGWVFTISPQQKKVLTAVLADQNAAVRLQQLLNDDTFIIFAQQFFEAQNIATVLKEAQLLPAVFPEKNNGKLIRLLKEKIIAAIPAADLRPAVKQWLYEAGKSSMANLNTANTAAISTAIIKESIAELINEQHEKPVIPKQVKQLSPEKRAGETAYIDNAGAVIIAAFLPRLFENTGVASNGSITDTEAAVSLIHYCVTGILQPAEFDVLLPKILCGILPATAVQLPVELTQNQIQEANEMLASVVEHWSILKNTSVSGLRQGFLQRNGKLSFNGEEWLLQVEQKGHDILLRQLPWNISMIKLPWMKGVLKTEWNF